MLRDRSGDTPGGQGRAVLLRPRPSANGTKPEAEDILRSLQSLELASQLAHKLSENGHSDLNIEIHLDVGENGRTKELIRDIIGMITGTGFEARIKPDAYGASKVADKHTR